MALAVVRNVGAPPGLRSEQDIDDFEQEIVDQYALAMAAAGLTDGHIAGTGAVVVRVRRASWAGRCGLRRSMTPTGSWPICAEPWPGAQHGGQQGWACRAFYDFLIARYQGDIHAPDRPRARPADRRVQPAGQGRRTAAARVPPADDEVEALFTQWGRQSLPDARKYLPAARDYLAASLWRRAGSADQRDGDARHPRLAAGSGRARQAPRPVRQGQPGRGPKTRLVPAINAVDTLLTGG